LKKEKEMTSWIIPLEEESEESHIGQLFPLTLPTHNTRHQFKISEQKEN
jgi:hypothetical protein